MSRTGRDDLCIRDPDLRGDADLAFIGYALRHPMKIRRHQSGSELFVAAGPMLDAHELENSLLSGLAGSDKPFAGCELALTAWSGREPLAALVQTSINEAILSHAEAPAARVLGRALAEIGTGSHGIVGPSSPAETAALAFASRSGCAVRVERRLLLYSLPRTPCPGRATVSFRPATADDAPRLVSWAEGFERDTRTPAHTRWAAERVCMGIKSGQLFVLEAGGKAVAAASWSRQTTNTKTVNFVYTPPDSRGRGYGQAVTACLAQHLLELGTRDILLFTDADDPIPNRVYTRVGFEPRAGFTHWAFARSG